MRDKRIVNEPYKFTNEELERIDKTPRGVELQALAKELDIEYRYLYQRKWQREHADTLNQRRKEARDTERLNMSNRRFSHVYWTTVEKELIMRSDKSDVEIAQEIGRTVASIQSMRTRLIREKERVNKKKNKKDRQNGYIL